MLFYFRCACSLSDSPLVPFRCRPGWKKWSRGRETSQWRQVSDDLRQTKGVNNSGCPAINLINNLGYPTMENSGYSAVKVTLGLHAMYSERRVFRSCWIGKWIFQDSVQMLLRDHENLSKYFASFLVGYIQNATVWAECANCTVCAIL